MARKKFYVLKARGELHKYLYVLDEWASEHRVGEGYIIGNPRVVTDDLRHATIFCVDGSDTDDLHTLKFRYKMYSKKMNVILCQLCGKKVDDVHSVLGDLESVDIGDCE